jgi:hypothetical protein
MSRIRSRRGWGWLISSVLMVCWWPSAATGQEDRAVVVQGAPLLSPDELSRACAHAEKLVADDNLDEAEALYRSLLGRADCAPTGLTNVKEKQKEASDETEAEARTQAAFDKRVKKIRALQREGFDEEARKELQKLVVAFPARDIPEDVRDPTQQLGGWRRFLAWIGPPAVTALEVLALVLGVFLVLAALRFLARRVQKRVQLAGFVGSEDKTLGESLSSALHDHLGRLKEQGCSPQLRSQPAEDVEFKLPDTVVSAVPQANLVASLLVALDKLVPRRIVEVKGTVRPVDPRRGAGVTIALSRRDGRSAAQDTFWEADYYLAPPPDKMDKELASRYARLLAAPAVWLAYQRDLGYKRSAPPLGTTNWRSYALFAAGEIAQDEGRRGDARRAYERALDHDPDNLGARLNLGALLLHAEPGPDGYPDEDEAAKRDRLSAARSLLEEVNPRAADWSTAFPYRARYLVAIGDLYSSLPEHALRHVEALRREARRNEHQEHLQPMLVQLRPAVDALALSAFVLMDADPDFAQFEDAWNPVATEYNVACAYNRWADRTGTGEERRDRRGKALDHLSVAVARVPGVRRSAKLDPALASIREDEEFADRWNEIVREPRPASTLVAA